MVEVLQIRVVLIIIRVLLMRHQIILFFKMILPKMRIGIIHEYEEFILEQLITNTFFFNEWAVVADNETRMQLYKLNFYWGIN